MHTRTRQNRRQFVRSAAGAGLGLWATPYLLWGAETTGPLKRVLGRTGFEVTTLGLGGQASLQWTPEDVDPEAIIAKAFHLGVNYFDTSNVYLGSQVNYGRALRKLGLVPGTGNFDEKKRRGVFLASKTMVRYARGSQPGMRANTQGPRGSTAVDDLRRTLSQVFGDGQGGYPPDAYIDLFQIHNLTRLEEVDALYEGLDKPDPKADRIGAFAALVDFRDGTNRTGLNPREERLIRHIGITGHLSSPVLMECIQRDNRGILDTLLVAINANDRRYFNHQYNVIPVARAKGMGIIGMKVFADGALYGKARRWTRTPQEVVRSVGSPALPSAPLVQYSLSVPGISTVIIGIGQIADDQQRCQLRQNLAAAQVAEPIDDRERARVEELAGTVEQGETNYFQQAPEPLGAPRELSVAQKARDQQREAQITWQTAYAGDQPLRRYVVERDGKRIGEVTHQPQIGKQPFTFAEQLSDTAAHRYRVLTVDAADRESASPETILPPTG
ncbi:MAG: aldo/keto reductase [Planctomycetota bacterium]